MKIISTRFNRTLRFGRLAWSAGMLLALVSCVRHESAVKPADVDYYTCTMHPSVRSQDPKAKCPICSMDLVPVMKKGGAPSPSAVGETNRPKAGNMAERRAPSKRTNAAEELTEFTVPVERQQQIGVTYGTVETQPLTTSIRTVGTVAYDKERQWDYVTRVDGYVEKLFVFSPGELVEKDAPLLTLYSPDLLTTQNEFVDVLNNRDEALKQGDPVILENARHLVESARQRLRLWNVSSEQIDELEKTRKPRERITLRSPFSGILQDLALEQGRRVIVGQRVVSVVDLSVVWVWAQFYENDLALLKTGLPVVITTSAYTGASFQGSISVLDPFLNDATRTGRVRIAVKNPARQLRPAMYVNVELHIDVGQRLAVPVPAVLPTGERNIVFVDKGKGKLEPRFVGLGRKFGGVYEVLAGLKENERVVTSANFLIDAEAKVQGALKSW